MGLKIFAHIFGFGRLVDDDRRRAALRAEGGQLAVSFELVVRYCVVKKGGSSLASTGSSDFW